MKIAIYDRPNSFSERWIRYCQKNGIDYKLVNPYDTDIVKEVDGCDAFMWHHHQANYKDCLFAKQLLFSLQMGGGITVFPNVVSGALFDDKVGEKYLLESIKAPTVPSYVFYTKQDALNWIENTTFPKVFKLRGGAGSANVMLAHSANEARKLVRKAFGKGFPQYDAWRNLKERYRKYRMGKSTLKDVMKGVARFVVKPEFARMHANEKGYVYFQDFIPNNTFDLRVITIGNHAFGVKRLCRKGDFRASGSGNPVFDKKDIDERCVKIAFELSQELGFQSMGYDFVFDENNNPLIVEMCYCYAVEFYDHCAGYWTSDMQWHEGSHFDFCGWMVEEVVKAVKEKQSIK
jgi:glutathione synthase/RimK-type ligase-like ATP-grasp enzyme